MGKLTERAPDEARKLAKRVAFGVVSALAVILVRKLVDMLWERVTGELPPSKKAREIEGRRR